MYARLLELLLALVQLLDLEQRLAPDGDAEARAPGLGRGGGGAGGGCRCGRGDEGAELPVVPPARVRGGEGAGSCLWREEGGGSKTGRPAEPTALHECAGARHSLISTASAITRSTRFTTAAIIASSASAERMRFGPLPEGGADLAIMLTLRAEGRAASAEAREEGRRRGGPKVRRAPARHALRAWPCVICCCGGGWGCRSGERGHTSGRVRRAQ